MKSLDPSPAAFSALTIRDPRRHTFALLILAGIPAGRAYERSGYHQRGARADSAGHKLRHHPEVSAFIAQEQEQLRQSAHITRKELVAWLVAVIQTPCGDLDASSPLVKHYSCEEIEGRVTRLKIEMVSKLEACRQLTALMGWNQSERVELTAADQLAHLIQLIRAK